MANQLPNLLDWARRSNPDGSAADVNELLSQCNDVMKDIIWTEGNLPNGNQETVRVGLPIPQYRMANQGNFSSKSLTMQWQDRFGELTDYSIVDKSVAEIGDDERVHRMIEDQAHIEGFSQKVASDLFYANEDVNPASFTGLAPRYGALTAYLSGRNVVDGGGTGSSNSSVWLVGWGNRSVKAIFPKGTVAGLVYENKGDVVPQYDSQGRRFEAWTSYFRWKLGLVNADWRWGSRIANLDTTSAGLKGIAPYDLFVGMGAQVNMLPNLSAVTSGITSTDDPRNPTMGVRAAFYANRLVRTAMDTQAMRDKNVLLTLADFAGAPTVQFRGIPIRVCDALINAEARVV